MPYIVIAIVWIIGFIYMMLRLRHGLHIFQLEHYKVKEYKDWIKNHLSKVFNPLYKKEKEKKPFVFTNRIKRIYITNCVILILRTYFWGYICK